MQSFPGIDEWETENVWTVNSFSEAVKAMEAELKKTADPEWAESLIEEFKIKHFAEKDLAPDNEGEFSGIINRWYYVEDFNLN
jgi:hypothetical protein